MFPITDADLKKPRIISRNYRNRRIGDFLKEMHMTEGRSTGFPKIYRAVKRNDSPMPVFETDERNAHFLATIPIHQAFVDEKAYLASIGKELDEGSQKESNCTKDCTKEITERQSIILGLFRLSATVTIPEIARKLKVSERTVKTEISVLQAKGFLAREGGRKDGRWVIIKK